MYTQYSTCTKQELKNQYQEINYKIRGLLAPYRNRNFLSVSEDELQIFRNKYNEYSCKKREIEMEIRRRMTAEDTFIGRVSRACKENHEDDMAKVGIVISAIYFIFAVVMLLCHI